MSSSSKKKSKLKLDPKVVSILSYWSHSFNSTIQIPTVIIDIINQYCLKIILFDTYNTQNKLLGIDDQNMDFSNSQILFGNVTPSYYTAMFLSSVKISEQFEVYSTVKFKMLKECSGICFGIISNYEQGKQKVSVWPCSNSWGGVGNSFKLSL